MNNTSEPKIASVRAAHSAKRMSVVDLDNIMIKDESSSKSKDYKSPSELRIQRYHKKQNGTIERSKSTPDLVAEIEGVRHGENIYAKANIQTGAGNVAYKENGGVWNRSPTTAHKGSPRGGRTVSHVGSVQKPPVYMDPSALHAGVYSGSYAKVYDEPKYMVPAVPGRNPIPKRPAPPPPSKGEVVSINTTAGSNGIYANVSEEIQMRKKSESPYESSFRPGTLARLSKHPQVLTNSLEQAKLKAHQRSASMGNIDMPTDDEGRPTVSFAEDKVFQNAASFIQKHPNATLLVTADVYKSQNKGSKYYEPEPDYDDHSDEDRRLHSQSGPRAQSSNSSTSSQRSTPARSERKMSSDSSGTVTVISIKADQMKKDSPLSNKRYTIHSDIPASVSAFQPEGSKIIIPPRPNEPAPHPPAVPSSSDSSRRSSIQSNFSGDRDNSSEKIPSMHIAFYNQNSNNKYKSASHTDKLHNSSSSSISTTKSSPSLVHKPPPESAPPPPPPPPTPPAAPPPPPLPTSDPPQLKNQVAKPQPLVPQVSSSDIMAAVAKRQVRLDTEGPRMTEEKPAPSKDPIKEKLTINQEALKAAVERRKNILNRNADTAVVESIEARLQKTKKLQAAKYFFSSDTMKRAGGNHNTGEVENKQEEKSDHSDGKSEGQVKSVFSSSTLKSVKTSKPSSISSELPKSTKTVPAPVPVKTTAAQKSPPKPAPKIEKAASQPPSPDTAKSKSESQPSDFLALAEKRRQEYLKKKSVKDDISTLPRAKQSPSASKNSSSHQSKTIEVLPAKTNSNDDESKLSKLSNSNENRDTKISIKDRIAKLEQRKKENVEVMGVTEDHSHTDGGSTLHRKSNHTNGYGYVAPPPGFDDAGQTPKEGVVQIDIIPPPAHFANESSTDEGVHSGDHGNSPAFGHDDAASQVSSVSTISTLSSEPGEGGSASKTNRSYEIAPPPPPGFDDSNGPNSENIQGSGFIPPPPEFGSDASKNKPLRPFQTKPVDSWLCTDVMDWLDSLNMAQYKTGFAKNCIDGPKLQGLGRNDYIELGVVQVGHRMNLERSIKKVAMGKSSSSSSTAEVIRL